MPFELIRNDIVKMKVDAVVNAANSGLRPGGGVCGAIFSAAGYNRLHQACRAIGHCDVGGAVITPGFDLPARYVIHAVGPIWQGGHHNEPQLLRNAYLNSLKLAKENGCESIAFPLISSGIYGYPKEEAFRVAVTAIQDFLLENDMKVYLILFGSGAVAVGEKVFSRIQSYIDDHYVEERYSLRENDRRRQYAEQLEEQESIFAESSYESAPLPPVSAPEKPAHKAAPDEEADPFECIFKIFEKRSLDDLLSHMDDSFSTMLLHLIDKKGMTDVEVYKRANIDRKLFSKLRKDSYNPSKQTAVALCIALRLNLDEAKDLLGRAGYAFSPSNKADVIVQYFIENEIYDILTVNEALFAFDQKLLGA